MDYRGRNFSVFNKRAADCVHSTVSNGSVRLCEGLHEKKSLYIVDESKSFFSSKFTHRSVSVSHNPFIISTMHERTFPMHIAHAFSAVDAL